MKQVRVEGEFPNLVAHRNRVVGYGRGGSLRIALTRACGDMLKKPELQHKRHTNFKVTVSVTEVEAKADV